jgi:hypothetical protein
VGRWDAQQQATVDWRIAIEKRLSHIDSTIATNSYAEVRVRIEHVEEDLRGLHRWKHTVVDPYIPRAIEDHERRLNRFEGQR